MSATSTRFCASASAESSSLNVTSPSLSWAIGSPFIEPEVSKSKMQGHRGSGFSANSAPPKGT